MSNLSPQVVPPDTVAVIGGGAAGFFTAVNLARKNPALQITIFEAGARPLQKVAISGGGRCNVTHACDDPKLLTQYYPRGFKELRSVFSRFQPADTVRWFKERGLTLKTESDGRRFPLSDESGDVISVFLNEAHRLGVRWLTNQRIESIQRLEGGFALKFLQAGQSESQAESKQLDFQTLVLTTGYSPTGWRFAESLGHTIIPPVPSLFPFKIDTPVIEGLQGLSVSEVSGRLTVQNSSEKPEASKFEASGPMLITHTGLSGPLIYRLSALGARALAASRYQASLRLDLLPSISEEKLRTQLNTLFYQTHNIKKIGNIPPDFQTVNIAIPNQSPVIPHRLWVSLLLASGADPEAQGAQLPKKVLNQLIEHLKRLTLPVTGKSPSKEEFVSCGGVDCKEVDFQTMKSKKCPGLYFAGEILNIDGLTGGFNFQAAWSTGWVASEGITNPQ